jgi:nucleotide-binding universal stress UspA family protein
MPDANDEGPILFAYDGSEHAKAAIAEAARELSSGREAIVLTVAPPFGALPYAGVPIPADIEADGSAEASRTAHEGARIARAAGFDAAPLVVEGVPIWKAIVSVADERHADVIVLGSHGRTGIRAVLMGSVASAAASHTDRPVMIVHLPAAAA